MSVKLSTEPSFSDGSDELDNGNPSQRRNNRQRDNANYHLDKFSSSRDKVGRTDNNSKRSKNSTGQRSSPSPNAGDNTPPFRYRRRSQRTRPRTSPAFQEASNFLSSASFLSPDTIFQWLKSQSPSRFRLYPKEQTQFIQLLAKQHRAYDAMLLFLKEYSNHSVYCYTAAMTVLPPGSTTLVMELLERMQDRRVTPNAYTLTAILHNHIVGAKAAKELLNSIQTKEEQRQRQKHPSRRHRAPSSLTIDVYNAALQAASRGPVDEWKQYALPLYFQLLNEKNPDVHPNQATFTIMVNGCGKAGQLPVALSLLRNAHHTIAVPNAQVWGAALTACARTGNVQLTKALLDEMPEPPTIRHWSTYAAALAKQGNDTTAMKLLEDLVQQGEEPDLIFVNTVLYACAKANHWEASRELMDRLKEGEFVVDGVPLKPDVVSYNTLLSACSDPIKAKELIKEMRFSKRHRHGATPPSQRSYTHAIQTCKKAGDLDTALQLLRQASRDDSLELNVYMYSAVIWTCERCGRPDVAVVLLEEMKEMGCEPNEVSYAGVISAFCQVGAVAEAVGFFEEFKENGFVGEGKMYMRLATAIKALPSTEAQFDLLEAIVSGFDEADFRVQAGGPILESLILAYGMNGRFDDAMSVYDRIVGPSNGPCLRAILSACSLANPPRWQEALMILHTSDIVDDAWGPAKMDMRAIGFAVIACSKSAQWEEGLNLLQLYAKPPSKHNPDPYSTIPVSAINSLITSLGRGGRPDLAIRLLNEMESDYGVQPDDITYRSAVIACNQAEHEKRRRVRQGREPRDSVGFESSSLQWWECALSLLRRMQESGLKPDPQTFSSVISACEAAGQWQRALAVLRSMLAENEEDANLFCYNAAVSACEKGGAWVEALELYFKMLDKGGVVTPNFVTLNCVLIALENAGQKEVAQDLYEDGVRQKLIDPWRRTRDATSGVLIRALDLHRCSGAMATSSIRSVMESLLPEGDRDDGPGNSHYVHDLAQDLVIIVGKGKGSEAEPVLLPTVQRVLRDDYDTDSIVDPANAGRVIVSTQQLQQFVASRSWCKM